MRRSQPFPVLGSFPLQYTGGFHEIFVLTQGVRGATPCLIFSDFIFLGVIWPGGTLALTDVSRKPGARQQREHGRGQGIPAMMLSGRATVRGDRGWVVVDLDSPYTCTQSGEGDGPKYVCFTLNCLSRLDWLGGVGVAR